MSGVSTFNEYLWKGEWDKGNGVREGEQVRKVKERGLFELGLDEWVGVHYVYQVERHVRKREQHVQRRGVKGPVNPRKRVGQSAWSVQ